MEIDLKKIEAELGIGKEVILELLKEYLIESEGLVRKLEGAVAPGDYETIISVAHTIKGLAGNLRITKIHETARAVEISGKEKKDAVSIKGQVESLQALHEELKMLLEKV